MARACGADAALERRKKRYAQRPGMLVA